MNNTITELKFTEDLMHYDRNNVKELEPNEVPDFIIEQIAKVFLKTIKEEYEAFKTSEYYNEEDSDEFERLLKRLNAKKIKQILCDYEEACVLETSNDKFEKIYDFEMDSDTFRYAGEIRLSADGLSYWRDPSNR